VVVIDRGERPPLLILSVRTGVRPFVHVVRPFNLPRERISTDLDQTVARHPVSKHLPGRPSQEAPSPDSNSDNPSLPGVLAFASFITSGIGLANHGLGI
jgi:hypothetical protein